MSLLRILGVSRLAINQVKSRRNRDAVEVYNIVLFCVPCCGPLVVFQVVLVFGAYTHVHVHA